MKQCEFTFSVCCHPEILLPWQRDQTISYVATDITFDTTSGTSVKWLIHEGASASGTLYVFTVFYYGIGRTIRKEESEVQGLGIWRKNLGYSENTFTSCHSHV